MNAKQPGVSPAIAQLHSTGSDTIVPDNLPVQRITDRLFAEFGGKWEGEQVKCHCPLDGHEDSTASFYFRPSSGEYKCFGCEKGGHYPSLARTLGIDGEPAGLIPFPPPSRQPLPSADRAQAIREKSDRLGQPTASYPYAGPDGTLRYEVLRYEPKTFRQRRPDGNGGSIWNLDGVERVPYRLPDLIASDPDALIWVCEGEKDCDRLASLDQIATTVAGGWNGDKSCLAGPLAEHPVAIIPDNDQQGETGAIRALNAIGPVAASVQIVRLPGLDSHGDVTDWLDAGHTLDDLAELIENHPAPYQPLLEPTGSASNMVPDSRSLHASGGGNHSEGPSRYRAFRLAELESLDLPELDWLVDGLIPSGSLGEIAGREKEGKSLLALDLCWSVAGGEEWAGRETRSGKVIYCPAEDSMRTVRDRLRRLNAGPLDDSRPFAVVPLSGVSIAPDHDPARLDLTIAAMVDDLRRMIRTEQPALLVLDCLREIHSARENDADDMSVTMRPLRQLAHEENVAIIVIHHAGRTSGDSRGSTAIAAACDYKASWTANGDDPTDDGPIRGTLAIRGRDVARTSIGLEMGEDLHFHTVAQPADAGAPNARGRILNALSDGQSRTAADIAERTGIALKTVQNVLGVLMKDRPPTIDRLGTGSRVDPFRYQSVRRPSEMVPPVPTPLGIGNREPSETDYESRPGIIGNDREERHDPSMVSVGVAHDNIMLDTLDPAGSERL